MMKLNGVYEFRISPCRDQMNVMVFVRMLNGAFGERICTVFYDVVCVPHLLNTSISFYVRIRRRPCVCLRARVCTFISLAKM